MNHGVLDHGLEPYVGTDRRQPRGGSRDTIRARDLAGFALALAVIGLALPTALVHAPTLDTAIHAQSALRTTWAMLFLCAGVFRLVRWRLTGETPAALTGCALFCFGLLSAPTAALAPVIHSSVRDEWLSPLTRTVAVVTFLALLVRSLRSAPVDARVRPLQVILRALGASWLVLLACITARNLHHPLAFSDGVWLAVGFALAAGWLALAAATTIRGIRRNSASYVWVGLGLLLMGVAELLHGMAFVLPTTIVFYGTCLQVVVAGLAIVNAASDLGVVFSADGNRLLNLTDALVESERQLTVEEARRQERLHDARSVIAALKAASLTLDRYDARLGDDVKHRLRTSLVSELARLERVIDNRRQEPVETFRLDTALMPVLVAEREQGLTITNQLGSLRAQGRPLELATVVQNLLVNARRYAPGSPVRVRASGNADAVQIFVEDRGPGVPVTEHERVFERGQRNTTDAQGSGLGLYLARQLMRDMGGEIVLRDRDGGGTTFVLSLPGPSAEVAVQHEVEVGQTEHRVADRRAVDHDGAALPGLPRQRDHHVTGDVDLTLVDDDDVRRREWRIGRRDVKTT